MKGKTKISNNNLIITKADKINKTGTIKKAQIISKKNFIKTKTKKHL